MNPCQRLGCKSPATHAIKLLAADDQDCNREAMLPYLRLCAACAALADPAEFIAMEPMILTALGLEPSDAGLVFAEPLSLGSMEFRAWEATARGSH